MRRRHLAINVAKDAKAPRIDEDEIESYSVEETQKILLEVGRRRHTARWAIALTLGLRQGEALGMKWADADLERGVIRLRRGATAAQVRARLRRRLRTQGRAASSESRSGRETKDTKSRVGRRLIALPDELLRLFRKHKEDRARERGLARQLWAEKDYVFASPTGEPLNPNTDYHEWKDILVAAGVREARLHDARHTAGTVLLLLKVPERIVMAIMGWSSASMAKRYQHVTDPMLEETAEKIGALLWGQPATVAGRTPETAD
ncbi:site-specific integrase [Streptomyces sp. TLI_053]|uniref:tyrosine-type recombinase/integrase n=1 Tax=Streptomyces sp. TLI_053 TaxID=1855352 RepID=UPI0025707E2D|nr:site-specific integrase [Streptomyces sp. TLI_053]